MSILKYVGIPYVVGGETFEEADCYGLCRLYSKNELGIELPKYMYTSADNEAVAEVSIKAAFCGIGDKWQKVDEPRHGDIIIFRIFGHEVHCGMALEGTQFLHSLRGRMSCVEDWTHVNWSHRKTGVLRYGT